MHNLRGTSAIEAIVHCLLWHYVYECQPANQWKPTFFETPSSIPSKCYILSFSLSVSLSSLAAYFKIENPPHGSYTAHINVYYNIIEFLHQQIFIWIFISKHQASVSFWSKIRSREEKNYNVPCKHVAAIATERHRCIYYVVTMHTISIYSNGHQRRRQQHISSLCAHSHKHTLDRLMMTVHLAGLQTY